MTSVKFGGIFLIAFFISPLMVESFVLRDDPDIINTRAGFMAFGLPDNETGTKLDQWKPGGQNPEEVGNYYEGDILIPRSMVGRNGIAHPSYRWKDATIPYVIKGTFTQQEKNQIEKAFKEYHTKTCIKFVPKAAQHTDYISIQNGKTGCWSSVGRVGGKQVVNLQTPYCVSSFGTVLHELYHASGFEHEQSREDRDEWVKIRWDKIPDGKNARKL